MFSGDYIRATVSLPDSFREFIPAASRMEKIRKGLLEMKNEKFIILFRRYIFVIPDLIRNPCGYFQLTTDYHVVHFHRQRQGENYGGFGAGFTGYRGRKKGFNDAIHQRPVEVGGRRGL